MLAGDLLDASARGDRARSGHGKATGDPAMSPSARAFLNPSGTVAESERRSSMTVSDAGAIASCPGSPPSPEESLRAGEALGRLLRPGDLVALFGELGSGKTLLSAASRWAWAARPEEVHSPSFTLVNEYRGAAKRGGRSPWRLAHIDLYRIRSEAEVPGHRVGRVRERAATSSWWSGPSAPCAPCRGITCGCALDARGCDRRRVSARPRGRSARILREWLATWRPCRAGVA